MSDDAGPYVELSFPDFVRSLFSSPPQDPYSFCMQFIDEMPREMLPQCLGHIIMVGAKNLYDKELAHLTPDEIFALRQYLWSIGWDVDMDEDLSVEPLENGGHHFRISFKPCSHARPQRPHRYTDV